MTLDWVSEEHEESEDFGVFDILVKRAATKENDRSRLLTKDQSLRCVVSMLPFNSCLETPPFTSQKLNEHLPKMSTISKH